MEVIRMKLNKRVIFALTLLIVLSWGLNMSQAGVSIPGCGEKVSLEIFP